MGLASKAKARGKVKGKSSEIKKNRSDHSNKNNKNKKEGKEPGPPVDVRPGSSWGVSFVSP